VFCGVMSRRQRAGRVGDVGWSPKAMVWERRAGVAWTSERACSYSASSRISSRIVGMSGLKCGVSWLLFWVWKRGGRLRRMDLLRWRAVF
jgi:hypothetical protein